MCQKHAIYTKHICGSGIVDGVALDGVVNNGGDIDMTMIDERNAIAFLLCLPRQCGEGEQGGNDSLLHKW